MKNLGRQPLLLAFFLLLAANFTLPSTNPPEVAVLNSQYTRRETPNPLFYDWEFQGALDTLKHLQVPYQVLSDQAIEESTLAQFKILILPNSKNLSQREIAEIRKFVESGGKLFATGFASYRTEKNQPGQAQNNFQLSDLFEADYLRFDTTSSHAGFIQGKKPFSNAVIPLGRNTAIMIRPHPGSEILGIWLDNDRKIKSFPGNLNAAILQNHTHHVIYCGENLLAPENSHSRRTQQWIALLLNRLIPGIASSPKREEKFPDLPPTGSLPVLSDSSPLISVGLPYPIHSGFVTSESPYSVFDENGKLLRTLPENFRFPFAAAKNGFLAAGQFSPQFLIAPADSRFPIKVVLWHGPEAPDAPSYDASEASGSSLTGRERASNMVPEAPYKLGIYRGALLLKSDGAQKVLVNRIPLEEYVAGVVSHEVPFDFHPEALKTMATVARTFALKEMTEKKFHGYDICATVQCQAYDGISHESSSSRRAVEQTRGMVVVYQNQPADLPYHATCGGITEDISRVWKLPSLPYLHSVVDGPEPVRENLSADSGLLHFLEHPPHSYCQASSRYRWRETYTENELVSFFRGSLPAVLHHPVHFHHVSRVSVLSRTPHGHVTALEIVTDQKRYRVEGDPIRWLFSEGKIGLGGLQSTLFIIQPDRNPDGSLKAITLIGGGWGHGVGLCQFGAEGMAQKGFSYVDILKHYYPGVSVEQRPAENTLMNQRKNREKKKESVFQKLKWRFFHRRTLKKLIQESFPIQIHHFQFA